MRAPHHQVLSSSFATLLHRLATRFPSRRAFAIAIGTDPSRLSRAMNGDPTMFDVLRCLYVARATRESPSVVLRAAGKGEIADLLEELYGAPKSPEALLILHAFGRLGPDVQGPVLEVLKDLYQLVPPTARTLKVRRRRPSRKATGVPAA